MFNLILCSILTTSFATAQESVSPQYIVTAGKIWGFLKYYHPAIAHRKLDADEVFIHFFKKVEKIKSKRDFNEVVESLLSEVGQVKKCDVCKASLPKDLFVNIDFNWIADTTVLNRNNCNQLQFVIDNYQPTANGYSQIGDTWWSNLTGNIVTDFPHEKAYKEMAYPSKEYRLLGLFRFWNVIQYFCPYKHLMAENWDSVLYAFLPKFVEAKDSLQYHLAIREMITKLHDSHSAGLNSQLLYRYFGYYFLPFDVTQISNKIVVINCDSAVCSSLDIKPGDEIMQVNGIPIKTMIDSLSPYICASNEYSFIRDLNYLVLSSAKKEINFTLSRYGIPRTILYHEPNTYLSFFGGEHQDQSKILSGNIGYINMESLTVKNVKKTWKELQNTRALIFDLRTYPDMVYPKFIKYLYPCKKEILVYKSKNIKVPGSFISEIIKEGPRKNKNYYKGKIVVLVNEYSQSLSEYTCMVIQAADRNRVKIIGSQTAGADGYYTYLLLPGNVRVGFSGASVLYPNGIETQRVGIKSDIEARPTIDGIKQKKDEVLEKALEYLLMPN